MLDGSVRWAYMTNMKKFSEWLECMRNTVEMEMQRLGLMTLLGGLM